MFSEKEVFLQVMLTVSFWISQHTLSLVSHLRKVNKVCKLKQNIKSKQGM
jgi:type III secretory pathway component EscT